jgi:amino acid adenylation domain-containing protein/non-ribosomal peptide synthase protein (TIGR01720 family)
MQEAKVQGFRFSPQQEHLWAVLPPEEVARREARCEVRIEGALDFQALTTAIRDLVARHEILRTRFRLLPGMKVPLQVIGDGDPVAVQEHDLRALGEIERGAALERIRAMLGEPRDLADGVPLRIALIHLAPEEHLLFLSLSALCCDEAGLENLVRDLSLAWGGGFAADPVQYIDVSEWHHDLLAGEEGAPAREHWRDHGLPAAFARSLPCELAAGSGAAVAACRFAIRREAAGRLGELAAHLDIEPRAVLLAAWASLLGRLVEGEELVLGAVFGGRRYDELKEVVGLLARHLPIRIQFLPGLAFEELAVRLGGLLDEAEPWQEPFSWQDAAGTEAGADPFLPFCFAFVEEPEPLRAGPTVLRILDRRSLFDRFLVKLSLVRRISGCVQGELLYDAGRLGAAEAALLVERFQVLLESALEEPGRPVERLGLLSARERRHVLVELNDTAAALRQVAGIHRLFEEQADRWSGHPAVVFGGRSLTYGELDVRAGEVAATLQALGVGPDTIVGLCVERSLELAVGILGVLKAGGAYLPLDPSYPAERLGFMIEDSGAPVLLTQSHLVAGLPSHRARVVCLDGESRPSGPALSRALSMAAGPGHLAYVIYTSGSTGRPKGVGVSHGNLVQSTLARTACYDRPVRRFLLLSSFAFDSSVAGIFWSFSQGGTLVLPDGGPQLDPEHLNALIAGTGITHMLSLPSLHGLMLAQASPQQLASLETVIVAGEACPAELVARHYEHCPGALLYNEYGPTEGTVWSSVALLPRELPGGRVSIGRPIANARIYLLDREMEPVPAGLAGELYIGGPGLARGYLGRPELTAERFVPDPFGGEPGGRLYRTGDLARTLASREIEFLGRLDHQVKIRGFRIELGEVEAAVLGFPGIQEAVAVAREDEPGDKRLVAYVVAAGGAAPDLQGLRDSLRQALPDYMVPAAFVRLDELPRTPNGKVDRRALPVPGSSGPRMQGELVAPRTLVEEVMAAIWGDVLGLDAVGVHDNFFDLGGHSLLATRVVSRLRQAFRVELTLRDLFAAPQVGQMAARVEQALRAEYRLEESPLVRAGHDAEFPLSFAQQRLWFFDQLEPGTTVYNIPTAVRLSGPLDMEALRRSLEEIVRRHEILRTTFIAVDGKPRQVIAPEPDLPFTVTDLRRAPRDGREERARRLVADEVGRPFDLARGPLLRAVLLELDDEDRILLLTVHHIVWDLWSIRICIRELSVLYAAFSRDQPSPLPELPIQYGDFARWQRQWLQGEVLESQLAYWRSQLAGGSGALELPLDHPRPSLQSFRGGRRALRLSPELSSALSRLSRSHGATLFMTLLAGFMALLSRITGQRDLSVGTPVAGRTRVETEDLIGFFVNTLVLRVDLAERWSFGRLLERVREVSLEAHTHQEVPFERLVDELHADRDLSRTSLFQVMFTLQNVPLGELSLPGLELAPVAVAVETAKFDLELMLGETASGLQGWWTYSTDLFDPATVARLADHLERLLSGAVAAPESPLEALPLLSAAESHQLRLEWNGDAAAGSGDVGVVEGLERQAARRPQAPALVCGGEVLSFGELNGRANALARRLRSLGVGRESRVGLCAERSPELVIGLLGILKAGGAYVPLDPSYPEARLRFLVADSGMRWVVTGGEPVAALPGLGVEVVVVEPGTAADLAEKPRPEDLAYLIYTSGTTGAPKAVMVEHASLANLLGAGAARFGWTAQDRMPCVAPFTFDIFLFELLSPLLAGGVSELVSLRPVLDLERLMSSVAESTRLHAVPTLLRQVVERARPEPARYERLRRIFVGGDAVPAELLRDVAQVWPWARLDVLYGPTEGTVICSSHAVPAGSWRPLLGRPLANMSLSVRDASGDLVPVGVAGELWIGGRAVSRGYLGRPELTAEKYVPSAGGRQYRTGDRGRVLGDGTLEFLGRMDQQVKVRGFRIEPGEVESALTAQPGVEQAVVVARADGGGVEKRLVAYLVGEAVDVGAVRTALRASLPDSMVPALFVVMEALPLTAHGKVDRAALPSPEGESVAAGGGRVAPRTEPERVLARIWSEVLGVPEVGVHDNFFDLGGDSILIIQILSRAQKAGLRLTPRQMFEHQTVADLARVALAVIGSAAEQSLVAGAAPLAPVQRSFLEMDLEPKSRFVQALLFEAAEPLSPSAVASAMALLVCHHDALRLRFVRERGAWTQRHAEPAEAEPLVARIDLSALPAEARRPLVETVTSRLPEGFDLTVGPLAAAVVVHLGGGEADRLLLAIHHLLVDGVSWRVLLEDFELACRAAAAGRPVTLPAKTTSFQTWAERLAEHARGAARQELPFWRLTDAPTALPQDAPEGENDWASARQVRVALPAAETEALLRRVPAAYRTRINDVLLAALARSLSLWSGSRHVLVELEGHGREDLFADVDLSRTAGWFTAVYPVAFELPEGGEAPLLKTVKEQLRRVPRGGIGFGVLRHLSADGEALAAQREPEISFNYLGQLDRTLAEGSLLRPGREPVGSVAPAGRRPRLLDVVSSVLGGRLQVSWTYSQNRHRRETIEELARSFLAELQRLIAHCLSPEAGGYTPSDFPLAGLDQATLDRLAAAHPDLEDLYPLSPMQEGMLFETLAAPGAGLYVTHMSCALYGELDEDALADAWRAVIERHEVLRTSFTGIDLARPLQVVHRHVPLPMERQDWRSLDAEEQERRLESLLAGDRERGFTLDRPPLLRLFLLRTGESSWRLAWSHHHVLLDGWSVSTLIAEVFASYDALRGGEKPRLDRPRPYRDYIAWLERQDLVQAETYWRQRLAGFRVATRLRLEPRPGLPAGPREEWRRLPAALVAALEGIARHHRLTLNTLLQGAWVILLSRYSGDSEVIFGTTVSGRPEKLAGVESIVGLFVNTLPVRAEVFPHTELGPWLADVQREQVRMREFESTSLARILAWSDVPRGTPLFQTLFGFENFPASVAFDSQAERSDRLTIGDIRSSERVDLPVNFGVMPSGEALSLYLGFDERRLETAAAFRMIGHFAVLLAGISRGFDQLVGDLPMLTEAEAAQVLVEWNDTGTPGSGERCLHTLFEAQTLWTPQAPAAISAGTACSYEELNARANQLAHHLRELGVAPEVPVGIFLERGLELLVAVLGVLKSGGAYVPIDPDYPAERVSFMLDDLGVAVVVTERRLAERLGAAGAHLVLLDADGPALAAHSRKNPVPLASPSNLAYAIYTSGSTGRPKAALVEHRSLAVYVADFAERLGLTPADRFLQFASPGFDVLGEELFPTWSSGGAVVLPAPGREGKVPVPQELSRFVEEQGVTAFELPTGYWQEWIYDLALRDQPPPRSLRLAIVGGQRVLPERLRDWRRSGLPLVHVYGLTEVTITSTLYQLPPGEPESDAELELPIGRPTGGTRLYVLDAGYQPVPAGLSGELFIGGPGCARGYFNRPRLTAERFVPDPFGGSSGGRLYRTGDLVRYRNDGNLEFLGRLDNQVKIRGYRVEPGEIESMLCRCPGVQEAVVLAHPDAGGESALTAYARVGGGAEVPTVTEMRRFLEERLPAYMLPAHILALPALPRTAHGKVDRPALPRPDEIRAARAETTPPRNLLEFELARIWEEILQLPGVGVTDNFFELGGQSLSAMRLVFQIKARLGRELPIVALFANPTVQGLAAVLRRESGELPYSPLVAIQLGGALPPFFCVHPAGGGAFVYRDLARCLGADRPFYAFQAPGQIEGQEPLDRMASLAALYVEAMREAQPVGPYLLGGWSFGAYVAFEMAQQLTAIGKEVALLAIFDVTAQPETGGRNPLEVSDAKLLCDLLELPISEQELMSVEPDRQLAWVVELGRQRNALPADLGAGEIARHLKLTRAHATAEQSYTARPYPGRISLFRAAEQPASRAQDRAMGWDALALGGLGIHEVPGNHMTMFEKSYVRALAEQLGQCLAPFNR